MRKHPVAKGVAPQFVACSTERGRTLELAYTFAPSIALLVAVRPMPPRDALVVFGCRTKLVLVFVCA